ncbi:FAD-binding oxidoreductase [Lysinibacillus pakistanensis]|uniref:FAD-binding oxidoreductase n=1 Tax=Lysinibacillus pakistanensis TaxID=759811 RepID=A0AAX3WUL5_9BACI|nr:FAD-binding oxidoreductase [Lysinibacillus pakistanensis]MDM5229824.1 FAD-binding oxidoreductase [Lysinibacillus pakistanensis]WHY45425.1 FAD-binding oxidoreductase [Lysinibacillus pakistanensis]WHY50433.1 FAD-binding oxidoreductase [Lysinibacillus pakistanensis]
MKKVKLTGRIVTPDDPGYEQARTNNNLNNPKYPSVIVFCQDTKDVINALNWARENNEPFRIRSGRHSYENYSLLNKGLVIDISDMNDIQLNLQEMTVKIEAGANLGSVYRVLGEQGVTIPAGTESSVGVVGLTLGGGIGMLSRPFGLTCDNLIEIEMVGVSGHEGATVIQANRQKNSDLLWVSCGGGGGNFGIVTALTFKLHPINDVAIFSITWGWEDFERAFDAWQKWAPYTDERLTSQIELKSKEIGEIVAQGEFVGSASELKKLLRPLRKTGAPRNVWIKEVPYLKAVEFFDIPSGNQPALRKRSGSFIERPFPHAAIVQMKEFLAKPPNRNTTIWQQSLGGAVGQVAPNRTAYYYRNALMAQEYNTSWKKPKEEEKNIRWVENVRRALSPYTTGDYVNFPDRFIKDWLTAYYGRNIRRLREVKSKYDPLNVFHFPQSIPPNRKWL